MQIRPAYYPWTIYLVVYVCNALNLYKSPGAKGDVGIVYAEECLSHMFMIHFMIIFAVKLDRAFEAAFVSKGFVSNLNKHEGEQ